MSHRLWVGMLLAGVLACGKDNSQTTQSRSPVIHTLTVAVTGGGRVTSSPAGIECGAICSASFAEGTQVTLSGSGASFSGDCTGSDACTITMGADRAVTARFGTPSTSFTLTVSVTGDGAVTSAPAGIDCGQTCSARFAAGTRVELISHPGASSDGSGWSAECLPLPTPAGGCVVEMSKDQTAKA